MMQFTELLTRVVLLPFCLSLIAGTAPAADSVLSVQSPNGRNAIKLQVARDPLQFEVIRDGKTIIGPSAIRLQFADESLLEGIQLQSSDKGTNDSEFAIPWGKTKTVSDKYSFTNLHFQTAAGDAFSVELRAYDDGIAFRYLLDRNPPDQPIQLRDETTEFALQGQPRVLFNNLDGFTTSHEALYQFQPLTDIPADRLMDCPLLVVWPDGQAAAITEARIRNFAGLYLEKPSQDSTTLRSRLSPLPEQSDLSVVSDSSLASPWRVVLLGDSAGQLLESNFLLCLNDPADGDFSWLQPGKTTFPWWNGDFEEDYKLPSGDQTFLERNRVYIDFCADNGIAFHAVHGDGRPWYVQTGGGYGNPTADADVRQARPEIHLPQILEYARDRGVGVRLWVHWKPLSEHLEEAFTNYESWGIKGLMVDFLDRDDQEMIEFTERMLESAARHKLHIQVHGSSKNSGEQRTWPHLINREGVLNLEYLKWNDRCTPDHTVNVAYTRALAGPVDYHSGGFRSVSRADFQPIMLEPKVLGTRCHHLALFVIFDNPVPMVADSPRAYVGQEGFDFLRDVPTTWDETRFVAGEPGEYIVLVRRMADTWYLGGITNWTPREVRLPLEFLGSQKFDATLYADGSPDASRPNEVKVSHFEADVSQPLKVSLSPGGGFVGVFSLRGE